MRQCPNLSSITVLLPTIGIAAPVATGFEDRPFTLLTHTITLAMLGRSGPYAHFAIGTLSAEHQGNPAYRRVPRALQITSRSGTYGVSVHAATEHELKCQIEMHAANSECGTPVFTYRAGPSGK